MNLHFVIISFVIFSVTNIELKGCQCNGNGELDMEEYILADLIAEVEVISFEQNNETQTSKTIVKIIENYKPTKEPIDTIVFSSGYGGCAYTLTSGKYLVWANKSRDKTYSLSICSRFIRLYERKSLKTYVSNLDKYKFEIKKVMLFLKKYRRKTGYINLIEDDKIITGNLEKGIPIDSWKIVDNKKSFVSIYSFKDGMKNGMRISYRLDNPLAKSTTNYKNGLFHGIRQSTFTNGVPNMITTYENGIVNGMKYYYHGNGKLRIKGNMVNGVEEGTWQYFRESGKLEKEILYELIEGEIPQRDLMIDNYSKREYLNYDEEENLIKKVIYKFREKIFEQEFTEKENDF